MSQRVYLLDTSVILPLVRGNALGKHIDQRFGLRSAAQRPFASVVSLGEVRVLAKRNDWGEAKLRAMSNALDNLIVVDINHPAVIDAYVELDLLSQSHPDGARNMGNNDLWIAACAKAARATPLTTGSDFTHLIPGHLDVVVIDPKTAPCSTTGRSVEHRVTEVGTWVFSTSSEEKAAALLLRTRRLQIS